MHAQPGGEVVEQGVAERQVVAQLRFDPVQIDVQASPERTLLPGLAWGRRIEQGHFWQCFISHEQRPILVCGFCRPTSRPTG